MKWEKKGNVDGFEDRRGMSGGGKAVLGGGAIAIVFFLVKMIFPEAAPIVDTLQKSQSSTQTEQVETRELSAEEKELGEFAKSNYYYNNETWNQIFQENGQTYQKPQMVLFEDGVNTSCGSATSASGPFYCPADNTVYMDLRFFEELRTRFGAKGGDFAIAYVIAHEVGHHIQNLVGTNRKVRQAQQGKSEAAANKYSVAQELQADFYAGVWASHNKEKLDAGDIDEAISAAQAVGDDAIQSKMQGHVQPETFTHGTSAERKAWFMKGYNTGDINQGDIGIIYNSIRY